MLKAWRQGWPGFTDEISAREGGMGRRAKTATAENPLLLPLQFLAAWIGMWLGEHQARVIEYQRAENAALRERLGKHRLRLTDGERRRLAKLGKALGRKGVATGGHHRDAGHHSAVVPWVRGGEVRRE